MNKRNVLMVTLALAVLTAGSPTVRADDPKVGIGIRPVGFSTNPDQFTFGVQAVLGRVKVTRFAPSIDFGFGDNVDLTTINLDLKRDLFSPPKASATLYAGAGPTISIISPDVGDSDTEIGLSLLAGLKLPFGSNHYYNLEARFGFGDIPDFKLMAGAMFGFGSAP